MNFIMNDKWAAGTGRFMDVRAKILDVNINDLGKLSDLSKNEASRSSTCTVFAESEVISLIGKGEPKENIARGVIDSITEKVATLCSKHTISANNVYLTGGLCESQHIIENLSNKIGKSVKSVPMARYAGAIGAALLAEKC